MKLHRFFIDQESAFAKAAMRFGLEGVNQLNTDNRAVSQASTSYNRSHGANGASAMQALCGTSDSVSQGPLYAIGETISIPSQALTHQIVDVFRLDKGDSVALVDGIGFDYVAHIVTIADKGIVFHVDAINPNPFRPQFEVTLYAAIPKGDLFEWIVEKATELGAARIVPVVAERSMKKDVRLSRLQKIACEAAEQSGRSVVSMITPAMEFADALKECSMSGFFTENIVLDTTVNTTLRIFAESMRGQGEGVACVADRQKGGVPKIALFVGPEGGWSSDELNQFSQESFTKVRLGQTTLRAETACCAGLAILLA